MVSLNVDKLRFDGGTEALGCTVCPLRHVCGGLARDADEWACTDHCRSCDGACDLVCLSKEARFAEDFAEVGGFDLQNLDVTTHPASGDLPRYIPVVQHGQAHVDELEVETVAIPLRGLMRGGKQDYGPVGATGVEIASRFRISPDARVFLLGTGRDVDIERYWRWRRLSNAPARLSELGLLGAVAPNFSVFLNEPRTQHLYNRKRSLICAAELGAAGVPAVPYIVGVAPHDWRTWETWLRERPHISVVAKEFQTGLANATRGGRALAELDRIQKALGRPLHVVAIGAARFRNDLAARFNTWTVIDSEPYMKAVKRQWIDAVGARVEHASAKDVPVDEVFAHNLKTWSARVADGWRR